MKTYREPAVAGVFYPYNAEALLGDVKGFLEDCRPEAENPVKILIVPHAGYQYSGMVAAQAYIEISSSPFKRVILTGPSHRSYFTGAAFPKDAYWSSPLGEVKLGSLDNPDVIQNSSYHKLEHSLEVQLPFLQYLLPDAEIIPLLLSGPYSLGERLADSLLPLDGEDVLWVVSSDFSHSGPGFQYYPKDFGFKSGEDVDLKAIEYITGGNTEKFGEFLKRSGATICGALPIMTAMFLRQKLNLPNFKLKNYDSSGRQTGDSTSVGYAALYC